MRRQEIPARPDGQRRLQQRSSIRATRRQGDTRAFWWPFAPYSVDGSPQEWERNRAGYTAEGSRLLAHYASNLEGDNLLGSYLFTPLDVETLNANMRQGAVRVGAYVPTSSASTGRIR